ncbi:major facilitator transporter [Streptomyces sp. 150FB]|uniref:sugar porter family MFS transporter n=1 Tax=Streptomyces sp. 150FB TaxID=1576605 RepID=UPI000588F6A7|nr:sugar porter family MFS transporter [Streptomyces sp. 150FB]KIF76973.1 major facilitator transporter [Streptomyces sp. 150FB]
MTTAKIPPPEGRIAPPDHIRHVIFITGAAAMGGFLFGYDSSVINGAVQAIRERYDIGSLALAQVIAIALIGSAIGAAVAGRIADRIGRIRCMRISSVLFTISAVGSALPFDIYDLAFWRIIGGFAIGMASVIGPAYIAEVAPAAYRGRFGSFQQGAIVLGIALSQLVNYGILQIADGDQRGDIAGLEAWQWMLGVMVLPAILYGVLSFAIPESPRYLISVGRREQARAVLAEVENRDVDLDARVAEIGLAMRREHKSTFRDLLNGRNFLPIVWVGIGLSAFQQLVGINVAFYYSATLWQSVGINPSSSFFYSFTTSIVNIIGTVIAIALVDRVGRKPLAIVGSCGMTVALSLEAWAFSAKLVNGKLPNTEGTTALIAAHVFVLFFALSWGVIVWVLLGEMFPNTIRAAALGVAASAQWIANYAITASFPSLSADWSLSGTYIIYACFAALSLPFVLKFVKETRGKTLEEMG